MKREKDKKYNYNRKDGMYYLTINQDPEDHANYYFATSLDNKRWNIMYKDKCCLNVAGYFTDILERLKMLNKYIKPVMEKGV